MLGWLLLFFGCRGPAPPAVPPDIVLVIVDALRADHLALYGHERATSPTLDALAGESLVFSRALSHAPWTLPATASILTGRLPSEHGATRDPRDALRFNRLDPALPTLAELLQARGYRTAAWVNNAYLAPEFGLDRGFGTWDYVGTGGDGGRSGAATVEAALAWLSASSQPAFALLHVMEPHYPYLAPERFRRRFVRPGPLPVEVLFTSPLELASSARWERRFEPDQVEAIERMYDEEVLAADDAIGQLVDGLRAQGRWPRTALAVTADHGEEFWDHGAFEHGHSVYGELLRVPLLLRTPARRAQRSEVLVQHADLFATLARLGGAEPPDGGPGLDLGALAGEATPQDRAVLSEDCLYGSPRVALTRGDRRLIVNLATRVANAFDLGPGAQGDRRIEGDAAATAAAEPLIPDLIALRGDLALHEPTRRTVQLDADNMEKLRSLGYIE